MACGMDISESGGMCAACILGAAVESLTAADHPALGPIAVRGRCPSVESLDQQFADFEFGELLGRGGSGWTFLATQKSLSRKVAVKLISRADSHHNELERFQREAGNLARLNHPNIVTVHDFGSTEQFLYIVMEYVPNRTLRSLIRSGPLDQNQVCRIGTQICRALHHAHESGLVHRDIKPENILIVNSLPDVEIRIADFGISQFRPGNESLVDLTRTGLVIGTPFYMAPEQQVPGKPVDRRADVFATGVVLYELLTGKLPQGRFESPSELNRCGQTLDAVVMQSLSNDPSDRFDSAGEFQRRLQSVSARETGNFKKPMLAAMTLVGLALIAILVSSQLSKSDDAELADASTGNTSADLSENTAVPNPVQPTLIAEDSSATSKEVEPVNPFLVAEQIADLKAEQRAKQKAEQKAKLKSNKIVQPVGAEVVAEDNASEIPTNYRKLLDDITKADFHKVRSALTTLKSVPPDPAIEELTDRVYQLTMDNNPFVSGDAFRTLAAMDFKRSVSAFENALQGSHSTSVRAIRILEELKDDRFLPVLAESFESTDSRYALTTIKSFGPKSESVLIAYIRQAEGWVHLKPAITALGEIGSEESYELLEKLGSSDEPFVSETASTALNAIKARINSSDGDE